jgi:hypothetical protein
MWRQGAISVGLEYHTWKRRRGTFYYSDIATVYISHYFLIMSHLEEREGDIILQSYSYSIYFTLLPHNVTPRREGGGHSITVI